MQKKYNKGFLADQQQGMPQGQNQGQPKGREKQMSPEQQQQFDLFVSNAQRIIQQAGEAILKAIMAQDPVDGVAQETLKVMTRLEEVALRAGTDLDLDVELAAANTIMGMIIHLYESKSGKPFSDEQRYQSFSLGVSMYLDNAVKTGKISKEELIQMGKLMQQNPQGKAVAAQMNGGM